MSAWRALRPDRSALAKFRWGDGKPSVERRTEKEKETDSAANGQRNLQRETNAASENSPATTSRTTPVGSAVRDGEAGDITSLVRPPWDRIAGEPEKVYQPRRQQLFLLFDFGRSLNVTVRDEDFEYQGRRRNRDFADRPTPSAALARPKKRTRGRALDACAPRAVGQ